MKAAMPHNYPLMLDVSDRLIAIVGGGEVAARKAEGLLSAGAKRVRVISPAFHERMPTTVERISDVYHREHLNGASLIFAATDDSQVNTQVVNDAHEIGALVCRADGDDESTGDFAIPAMIRRGPVVVTVSSGGSPALAAKMRDSIEHAIDPRCIKMAETMQSLRPTILSIPSLAPSRRRDIFRELATDQALSILETGGQDELHNWLQQSFPELKKIQRA
jgi:precorrin-2 dehydrogenase/sirohydrochlorin ferrochelatase